MPGAAPAHSMMLQLHWTPSALGLHSGQALPQVDHASCLQFCG